MIVTVVPYRPEWAAEFERESALVREVLGAELAALFHIGSTAVAGLDAKPIIDMLPVVRDLDALDALAPCFEALGYEVMGEFGIPGRRYYRKGGVHRTHQIHAFRYDDANNILRHIALRDYLRHHPAVREEYGTLKQRLAALHPEDITAYSGGKDHFVKELERQALIWYFGRMDGASYTDYATKVDD